MRPSGAAAIPSLVAYAPEKLAQLKAATAVLSEPAVLSAFAHLFRIVCSHGEELAQGACTLDSYQCFLVSLGVTTMSPVEAFEPHAVLSWRQRGGAGRNASEIIPGKHSAHPDDRGEALTAAHSPPGGDEGDAAAPTTTAAVPTTTSTTAAAAVRRNTTNHTEQHTVHLLRVNYEAIEAIFQFSCLIVADTQTTIGASTSLAASKKQTGGPKGAGPSSPTAAAAHHRRIDGQRAMPFVAFIYSLLDIARVMFPPGQFPLWEHDHIVSHVLSTLFIDTFGHNYLRSETGGQHAGALLGASGDDEGGASGGGGGGAAAHGEFQLTKGMERLLATPSVHDQLLALFIFAQQPVKYEEGLTDLAYEMACQAAILADSTIEYDGLVLLWRKADLRYALTNTETVYQSFRSYDRHLRRDTAVIDFYGFRALMMKLGQLVCATRNELPTPQAKVSMLLTEYFTAVGAFPLPVRASHTMGAEQGAGIDPSLGQLKPGRVVNGSELWIFGKNFRVRDSRSGSRGPLFARFGDVVFQGSAMSTTVGSIRVEHLPVIDGETLLEATVTPGEKIDGTLLVSLKNVTQYAVSISCDRLTWTRSTDAVVSYSEDVADFECSLELVALLKGIFQKFAKRQEDYEEDGELVIGQHFMFLHDYALLCQKHPAMGIQEDMDPSAMIIRHQKFFDVAKLHRESQTPNLPSLTFTLFVSLIFRHFTDLYGTSSQTVVKIVDCFAASFATAATAGGGRQRGPTDAVERAASKAIYSLSMDASAASSFRSHPRGGGATGPAVPIVCSNCGQDPTIRMIENPFIDLKLQAEQVEAQTGADQQASASKRFLHAIAAMASGLPPQPVEYSTRELEHMSTEAAVRQPLATQLAHLTCLFNKVLDEEEAARKRERQRSESSVDQVKSAGKFLTAQVLALQQSMEGVNESIYRVATALQRTESYCGEERRLRLSGSIAGSETVWVMISQMFDALKKGLQSIRDLTTPYTAEIAVLANNASSTSGGGGDLDVASALLEAKSFKDRLVQQAASMEARLPKRRLENAVSQAEAQHLQMQAVVARRGSRAPRVPTPPPSSGAPPHAAVESTSAPSHAASQAGHSVAPGDPSVTPSAPPASGAAPAVTVAHHADAVQNAPLTAAATGVAQASASPLNASGTEGVAVAAQPNSLAASHESTAEEANIQLLRMKQALEHDWSQRLKDVEKRKEAAAKEATQLLLDVVRYTQERVPFPDDLAAPTFKFLVSRGINIRRAAPPKVPAAVADSSDHSETPSLNSSKSHMKSALPAMVPMETAGTQCEEEMLPSVLDMHTELAIRGVSNPGKLSTMACLLRKAMLAGRDAVARFASNATLFDDFSKILKMELTNVLHPRSRDMISLPGQLNDKMFVKDACVSTLLNGAVLSRVAEAEALSKQPPAGAGTTAAPPPAATTGGKAKATGGKKGSTGGKKGGAASNNGSAAAISHVALSDDEADAKRLADISAALVGQMHQMLACTRESQTELSGEVTAKAAAAAAPPDPVTVEVDSTRAAIDDVLSQWSAAKPEEGDYHSRQEEWHRNHPSKGVQAVPTAKGSAAQTVVTGDIEMVTTSTVAAKSKLAAAMAMVAQTAKTAGAAAAAAADDTSAATELQEKSQHTIEALAKREADALADVASARDANDYLRQEVAELRTEVERLSSANADLLLLQKEEGKTIQPSAIQMPLPPAPSRSHTDDSSAMGVVTESTAVDFATQTPLPPQRTPPPVAPLEPPAPPPTVAHFSTGVTATTVVADAETAAPRRYSLPNVEGEPNVEGGTQTTAPATPAMGGITPPCVPVRTPPLADVVATRTADASTQEGERPGSTASASTGMTPAAGDASASNPPRAAEDVATDMSRPLSTVASFHSTPASRLGTTDRTQRGAGGYPTTNQGGMPTTPAMKAEAPALSAATPPSRAIAAAAVQTPPPPPPPHPPSAGSRRPAMDTEDVDRKLNQLLHELAVERSDLDWGDAGEERLLLDGGGDDEDEEDEDDCDSPDPQSNRAAPVNLAAVMPRPVPTTAVVDTSGEGGDPIGSASAAAPPILVPDAPSQVVARAVVAAALAYAGAPQPVAPPLSSPLLTLSPKVNAGGGGPETKAAGVSPPPFYPPGQEFNIAPSPIVAAVPQRGSPYQSYGGAARGSPTMGSLVLSPNGARRAASTLMVASSPPRAQTSPAVGSMLSEGNELSGTSNGVSGADLANQAATCATDVLLGPAGGGASDGTTTVIRAKKRAGKAKPAIVDPYSALWGGGFKLVADTVAEIAAATPPLSSSTGGKGGSGADANTATIALGVVGGGGTTVVSGDIGGVLRSANARLDSLERDAVTRAELEDGLRDEIARLRLAVVDAMSRANAFETKLNAELSLRKANEAATLAVGAKSGATRRDAAAVDAMQVQLARMMFLERDMVVKKVKQLYATYAPGEQDMLFASPALSSESGLIELSSLLEKALLRAGDHMLVQGSLPHACRIVIKQFFAEDAVLVASDADMAPVVLAKRLYDALASAGDANQPLPDAVAKLFPQLRMGRRSLAQKAGYSHVLERLQFASPEALLKVAEVLVDIDGVSPQRLAAARRRLSTTQEERHMSDDELLSRVMERLTKQGLLSTSDGDSAFPEGGHRGAKAEGGGFFLTAAAPSPRTTRAQFDSSVDCAEDLFPVAPHISLARKAQATAALAPLPKPQASSATQTDVTVTVTTAMATQTVAQSAPGGGLLMPPASPLAARRAINAVTPTAPASAAMATQTTAVTAAPVVDVAVQAVPFFLPKLGAAFARTQETQTLEDIDAEMRVFRSGFPLRPQLARLFFLCRDPTSTDILLNWLRAIHTVLTATSPSGDTVSLLEKQYRHLTADASATTLGSGVDESSTPTKSGQGGSGGLFTSVVSAMMLKGLEVLNLATGNRIEALGDASRVTTTPSGVLQSTALTEAAAIEVNGFLAELLRRIDARLADPPQLWANAFPPPPPNGTETAAAPPLLPLSQRLRSLNRFRHAVLCDLLNRCDPRVAVAVTAEERATMDRLASFDTLSPPQQRRLWQLQTATLAHVLYAQTSGQPFVALAMSLRLAPAPGRPFSLAQKSASSEELAKMCLCEALISPLIVRCIAQCDQLLLTADAASAAAPTGRRFGAWLTGLPRRCGTVSDSSAATTTVVTSLGASAAVTYALPVLRFLAAIWSFNYDELVALEAIPENGRSRQEQLRVSEGRRATESLSASYQPTGVLPLPPAKWLCATQSLLRRWMGHAVPPFTDADIPLLDAATTTMVVPTTVVLHGTALEQPTTATIDGNGGALPPTALGGAVVIENSSCRPRQQVAPQPPETAFALAASSPFSKVAVLATKRQPPPPPPSAAADGTHPLAQRRLAQTANASALAPPLGQISGGGSSYYHDDHLPGLSIGTIPPHPTTLLPLSPHLTLRGVAALPRALPPPDEDVAGGSGRLTPPPPVLIPAALARLSPHSASRLPDLTGTRATAVLPRSHPTRSYQNALPLQQVFGVSALPLSPLPHRTPAVHAAAGPSEAHAVAEEAAGEGDAAWGRTPPQATGGGAPSAAAPSRSRWDALPAGPGTAALKGVMNTLLPSDRTALVVQSAKTAMISSDDRSVRRGNHPADDGAIPYGSSSSMPQRSSPARHVEQHNDTAASDVLSPFALATSCSAAIVSRKTAQSIRGLTPAERQELESLRRAGGYGRRQRGGDVATSSSGGESGVTTTTTAETLSGKERFRWVDLELRRYVESTRAMDLNDESTTTSLGGDRPYHEGGGGTATAVSLYDTVVEKLGRATGLPDDAIRRDTRGALLTLTPQHASVFVSLLAP